MTVRYKVVPPAPDSLEGLETARRAIPLVPAREDDCCARLMDRVGVPARDEAKEWLTFMGALGLIAEAERGYHRTRDPFAAAELAAAFGDRMYGVEALLCVLDRDEPVSVDGVFEQFVDSVPRWERRRHVDPRQVWRERVRRLLDWAVLFGLTERIDDGYVRA